MKIAYKVSWWAYLHTNGSIQVKRYFDTPMDLIRALESSFVQCVTRPFNSENREEAIKKAGRLFNGEES